MNIFSDWGVNGHSLRVRLLLVAYRLCNQLYLKGRIGVILGLPFFICYRIIVEWVFGCEISWKTTIQGPISIFHVQGIVVNPATKIGRNVILRHNTTLGAKATSDDAPTIEDYVDIGSNVVIIGPIRVGGHSIIGAGSVVTKDIPPWSVVAGNPARILRENHEGI